MELGEVGLFGGEMLYDFPCFLVSEFAAYSAVSELHSSVISR